MRGCSRSRRASSACPRPSSRPRPARWRSASSELVAPARLRLAYPGAWLRDDVFAMHGHYVDLHSTVPTFERLAAGAMARWVVRLPAQGATPDDYEAALAPIYAFLHQLTQRSDHAAVSAGAGASARAWVAMAGDGRARRPVRTAALGAGYVAAVAALNALGLGPIDRELSGAALRRGGLHGIREVLRRLGIRAPHVLFGHTHRSGRGRATIRPNGGGSRARGSSTPARGSTSRTSSPTPQRVALLAGDRGRSSRTRGRRGSSGCWANADTGSCDPRREAGGVAGHAGARARASSTPAVWWACSTSA